ncbi:TPA: NAD(P)/FAD-dependent oxidoreductase [Burkholderia multivorans]|uniref:FAD-dependent oxidoreductase n=1 Tax=Burkholderia multivorans TaxID=87883 RepID=UPI0020195F9D|nr:NAD(P)/FAD-dependent oxidoreductase [Burkholderia multivorans]MCO1459905.1 NAD(P)/FAD-dependent oxidoreductase [Burkholderia multivorans]UQO21316.1 NAD(P)/FAD-dependent oxidoreductase [Burkholderia multivorans]HEM7842899.1 NAD(P)/FAD-dependent oxidoreductase [Burkholderia multivorans]HEM7908284.1 NAD(P)/FAD-dependent oxidoreductase [Burkholderia multivorans]HEM8539409.1 NAD(P)/FAD-dependent oxidoreductase [Burkholderia multivorans]
MTTLPQLNTRVSEDLRLLGLDPENWIPDVAHTDHDVLVVGGGQSGVATAFALRRAGVRRTSVIEAQPPERTGSWRAKARMVNLRTAKTNLGPDFGIPSLTFQAWYEAIAGRAAYDELERIPTGAWADYLDWLKTMTRVDVRYRTRLLGIEHDGQRFRVRLDRDGQHVTETCRKIVFATGIAGCGEPFIPAVLTSLPPHTYAHTDAQIDFTALRGKTVAVIGAASAAFDAAGTALEAGAKQVHLFCRADRLAPSSNMATLNYPGAQENFYYLPDAVRWKLAWHFRERSPGPTPEVVARATRFDNFHLHLGSTDLKVQWDGNNVGILSHGVLIRADTVIAGTGYKTDLSLRPELTAIAPLIALWRDRYSAPTEEQDRPIALSPYLGPGYQLQERVPGTAPWVRHLYCFNFAAITSFGRHVGDVGSLREGIPRLVRHIVRDLFLDDIDQHVQRLTASVNDELSFAAYAHSVVVPASLDA